MCPGCIVVRYDVKLHLLRYYRCKSQYFLFIKDFMKHGVKHRKYYWALPFHKPWICHFYIRCNQSMRLCQSLMLESLMLGLSRIYNQIQNVCLYLIYTSHYDPHLIQHSFSFISHSTHFLVSISILANLLSSVPSMHQTLTTLFIYFEYLDPFR